MGYFTAARCKIDTAIYEVGPLSSAPGRVVSSGGTINITGNDFGDQCASCQVLAIPVTSTTQTALQVSSWATSAISAVLPASLTGLLTIQVNATTGTDAITIMAAAPGPALAATPSSLQFAYTAGGAVPAAQTIQISNSGSGTLTWTVTSSQSWLSVSAAAGTAPSNLTASVSPAALSAGTYTAAVQITGSGASNSPLSVAVTLTVTAAAMSLAVTPQALSFTYTAGGAVPAAQTVSIADSGSGTLAWTATSSPVSYTHLSHENAEYGVRAGGWQSDAGAGAAGAACGSQGSAARDRVNGLSHRRTGLSHLTGAVVAAVAAPSGAGIRSGRTSGEYRARIPPRHCRAPSLPRWCPRGSP